MLCWNHGYHESRRRFNLNFNIKPARRITHLRDCPPFDSSFSAFQRFAFRPPFAWLVKNSGFIFISDFYIDKL
jgi:hypothetical protein